MKLFGSTLNETLSVLSGKSPTPEMNKLYPELMDMEEEAPPISKRMKKKEKEEEMLEPELPLEQAPAPSAPLEVAVLRAGKVKKEDKMVVMMRFAITAGIIGFAVFLYLRPELNGKDIANTMIGGVLGYWLK